MLNRIITVLFFTLLLFSCSKKDENSAKVFWGKTDYYKNFLFKKYEPVIMTKKIEFDFNEDAEKGLDTNIKFKLVEKDPDGNFNSTADVLIYKNGILCADNILTLQPKDTTLELGMEFTPQARKGNHTLYLQVLNSGGLDRIDDIELSSTNNFILAHEWVVKKDEVYNPLAIGLFWIVVCLLTFLVVWRFVIRPILYETFKVRKLYVFCPGSPMKTLTLKGAYKAVASNRMKKQSIFNKFFKGKIVFTQNEFWEHDIEFIPGTRKTVRARMPKEFTIIPSSRLTVGIDTEIINNKNNKVAKLQIN